MAPRERLDIYGGGHPSRKHATPSNSLLDLQPAVVIKGEAGSGLCPRHWVASPVTVVGTHLR